MGEHINKVSEEDLQKMGIQGRQLNKGDQPFDVTFHNEGEVIGQFLYDSDKKEWTFEGNTSESAKIFVREVLEKAKDAEWRAAVCEEE